MSRVIVKNLPKTITEDRLIKHFSSHGTVTDVKLMKTKDGVFRKFAFVGFQTDDESHKAMGFFNKTFIDSSKIVVESAIPFGDGNLARPWSKYSAGSSANDSNQGSTAIDKKRKKLKSGNESDSEDEKFQEFLDVHKKDRTIWGNDETVMTGKKRNVEEAVSDSSSDEEYDQEVTGSSNKIKKLEPTKAPTTDGVSGPEIPSHRYTVVLKGIPFAATEADIKKFFHPLAYRTVRMTLDKKGRPSGKCFVDFKSESDLRKSLKYNKKYMGPRYVEVFRDTGTKAEKDGVPQNQRKNFTFSSNQPDESKDSADSGCLFVRNLPYECNDEQLKAHFEKIGPVSVIDLPLTKNNKTKGFAYITFLFPEHAIKATNELTFKPFQGRLIHIIPSNKIDEEGNEDDSTDFKKKKLKKQKQSLQDGKCWNTLFLNQNAVSDYLAHRLKVSKSDVLDPNSENSAIQLALGETQLLQEIKEFLTNEGVILDSFTSSKRSKRIIVCKNIPFGTQERELNELFSEHGSIGRLVLPPTGTIALIEYIDPSEAMKAYKKLSYSKFKHLPLYLEWAPEETFSEQFKPSDKKVYKTVDEDLENMEHATLFVKNLNFDITEAELKAFFEKSGSVTSVSIAKKPSPKSANGFLSRGYGFVEFGSKESAKDAMKKLNGKLLQDYAVELKLSEKQISKVPETVQKARNLKEASAKLLIKNIPFETTRKDLRKLFSAFGDIKHIRLPKKLAGTGDHRGFAFVEFSSIAEARKAFEATGDSTHIYGRRLVVEWAKEDATVAEMREKTAEVFVPTEVEKKKKTVQGLEIS